jgi:hypothetical protein
MPNHDLKLARALRGVSLERLPTFWDQFDALAHIPFMVIRGANSDMPGALSRHAENSGERARLENEKYLASLAQNQNFRSDG